MRKLTLIISGFILGFILISCGQQAPQEKSIEEEAVVEKVHFAPDWTKNANIYEVNLRQYTEEGSMNAFAKELPRLKEMGVDILWFMPIHPISEKNRKGSLGSYYAAKDYKAVNPEFGTIEDFKNLVAQAHELDMYVMLDWVANHTGWDHIWTETNPEFYEKDENGELISPFDWTDVISLDYTNDDMQLAMIDALKFWIEDANIDGYRCDVASEVPTEFWERARPELESIKEVFMLAESEQTDLLENAFDMNYGWEFHHIMNQIAKGEKGPKDVLEYLQREDEKTPEKSYTMYFITNHDENSWNGTIAERLGDADEVMAVLTYTLGGMPLIYSGQEAANTKRLEFFEKDPINWDGFKKQGFYKELNKLKHEIPALWNGSNGGVFQLLATDKDDQVLCFTKKKGDSEVMVLTNLSDQSFQVTFIEDNLINYKPLMISNFQPTMEVNSFTMMPWGYCILQKVNVE